MLFQNIDTQTNKVVATYKTFLYSYFQSFFVSVFFEILIFVKKLTIFRDSVQNRLDVQTRGM